MTNPQVYNVLTALKDLVNFDLLPLFDSLKTSYVPAPTVFLIDWISYIKSTNFDPAFFVSQSQSFKDYVANANNFLALKSDSVAFGIVKSTSSAWAIFFASPCLPLLSYLPSRQVSLSAFNGESMTGYVYIVSYRPYTSSSTDTSIFWELRVRSSNLSLCHVVASFRDSFNLVGLLVPKSTLGNYYSSTSSYLYDPSCTLRVIDV